MNNIEDVNSYLKSTGLGFLHFYSIGDLLSAYISTRDINKLLLEQTNKTMQDVRNEIEKDWIAGLDKGCYTLEQLEKMTLLEISELISPS